MELSLPRGLAFGAQLVPAVGVGQVVEQDAAQPAEQFVPGLAPEIRKVALGDVVGFRTHKRGRNAFRYSDDRGMENLGTLGNIYSQARATNIFGDVVGWSQTDDYWVSHGILYTDKHGLLDLEELVDGWIPDLAGYMQPECINTGGGVHTINSFRIWVREVATPDYLLAVAGTEPDLDRGLVDASNLDSLAELSSYNVVLIGNNGTQDGDRFEQIAPALRDWVESGGGLVATGYTDTQPPAQRNRTVGQRRRRRRHNHHPRRDGPR